MSKTALKTRCGWVNNDPLYIDYHDKEWGRPIHDERELFEFLILEGMQAGLSWYIVLKKRDAFRKAFDNFDAAKIARYTPKKIEALAKNESIIRNRLKLNAAVRNAKAFLAVQKEFGSFDRYIWNFVGGKPIKNHWQSLSEVPCLTDISDAMAKDLKKRGFTFVGTKICYAFMQATGMVNDHVASCFLHPK
ncbi:MAG: DNA-3-methyladenine glycosylase I [Gammaproteobacteria bacterium CG11_big_fil_rev_8_21_14_0_20_46_22]|nr:MAG: DNA-3-methyladenine glycosylase I [Gammaproteobacteria bacterium CG12_big_fil_rev_8_21_14_0_65_46_12]PIR10087.1 MAG: DNA-3-methyladenine glycosylase I [Gammaproteobacteria bacterium CG11_big_fil_rev_8_21_14_0_20_46_22]